MRVISGKFKGKPLISPEGDRVRPTSDRIKETIFNILSSRTSFEDAIVLDLFSGSGSLGIEALSRGAKEVIFCDIDVESIRLTKENLKKIGYGTSNVFHADYQLALKKLHGKKFDLIFLDPPYYKKYEEKILSLLINYDLLSSGGIIVFEHAIQTALPDVSNVFDKDFRPMGTMAVAFYSLKNNAEQC